MSYYFFLKGLNFDFLSSFKSKKNLRNKVIRSFQNMIKFNKREFFISIQIWFTKNLQKYWKNWKIKKLIRKIPKRKIKNLRCNFLSFMNLKFSFSYQFQCLFNIWKSYKTILVKIYYNYYYCYYY